MIDVDKLHRVNLYWVHRNSQIYWW